MPIWNEIRRISLNIFFDYLKIYQTIPPPIILISFMPTSLKKDIILNSSPSSKEGNYSIPDPYLPQNLSPWFLTGFFEAEGCFSVIVNKKKSRLWS